MTGRTDIIIHACMPGTASTNLLRTNSISMYNEQKAKPCWLMVSQTYVGLHCTTEDDK